VQQSLKDLIDLLDLEQIEKNYFRGISPAEGWQRVYGGQVLGQALVAASRTVDADRHAHSLHGYFLRPGDVSLPILYTVDRIRDGKSFTTRRVVAVQRGKAIFSMSISFQIDEQGLSHQADMPDVPPPEDLKSEAELYADHLDDIPEELRESDTHKPPIEMRPVEQRFDLLKPRKRPPNHACWMKSWETLPDDRRLHQCVLAYLSDWSLLETAMLPHALSIAQDKVQVASLDHAMWFHRQFRADEWLLYAQDSPSASGARGFNRGLIFSRDGKLVASVAQEGLMRVR